MMIPSYSALECDRHDAKKAEATISQLSLLQTHPNIVRQSHALAKF
nr:hypothetical protein [Oscillatoria sp. FACHB-1407]